MLNIKGFIKKQTSITPIKTLGPPYTGKDLHEQITSTFNFHQLTQQRKCFVS